MNHVRRELPFSEWPAIDPELWTMAFKDEGLFEQVASACHWAFATATQCGTAIPSGSAT